MSTHKRLDRLIGSSWDPAQYTKFADHRLRPAIDLLNHVSLVSPRLVVDLGCGTGNVTRLLAERWPSAAVQGLDNSSEMLEKARTETGEIHWREANIVDWAPDEKPDLIYSNAVLHWVDGHTVLFPRLIEYLNDGGCLAVQMPLSWDAQSHRLMRETLADGGVDGKTIGDEALREALARQWVEDTGFYYDLLAGRVRVLDIWETEYLQVLDGMDPVLEWVKSTGLRPILKALSDTEREIFLAEYRRRLCEAYPCRNDGRTLYPFRRLFIVAHK